VAFDLLGTKQVVLGTEKVTNDLFVKRGNIYSGRGIPAALEFLTQGLVTALMQKTGKVSPMESLPLVVGRKLTTSVVVQNSGADNASSYIPC
jgi:hypothetical protein